ncbi:MAG: extracellular solute-binding protein [Oscillospiraceae bacterium]|nr:extracellular solute-binding protein [Oscillospiraceae bacterium]
MYIDPAKKKFIYAGIAAAVVIVIVVFALTRGAVGSFYQKYEGFDLTAPASGRSDTYVRYLDRFPNAAFPSAGVVIDLADFNEVLVNPVVIEREEVVNSRGATIETDLEGEFGDVGRFLMTDEYAFVEYTVDVPAAGFYNLKIDFFPVESRGVDIERAVYINGSIPFRGADIITFYRTWGDLVQYDNSGNPYTIRTDNQNNQIRATQVEMPRWETSFFMDSQGYFIEPYKFYFEAGANTIALESVNEPLAIKSFELVPVRDLPTHAEFMQQTDLSRFSGNRLSAPIIIQGEDSKARSSASLYPFFDTSSATTEPYSVRYITLNAIGGGRWGIPGQWIEWDIEVPEDGLYRLDFKSRQNYNRGMVSNRTLFINGEIPFQEALAIPFHFSSSWDLVGPTDLNGNPLFFPLGAGTNTIRLQVTLGDISTTLSQIEESVLRLNEIYLQVLVLTGPDPDPNRDYRLEEYYPDLITRMDFESRYIYKLMDDIIEYTGQMGPEVATLQSIARQLEVFVRKPQDIPRGVVVFKENIAAVGTTLIGLSSAPLDIDWIALTCENTTAPKVSENFFQTARHEILSFLATFFVDFNNIGDVHRGRDVTEVWIFSGRDQSTILKSMIDDTYTPSTANPVNLRLVDLAALMPAVVAGSGPDVALTVNNADPINYAFRSAAKDLRNFTDFYEVKEEFHPEAFVPFEYLGGYYGIPETQIFPVMFYRMDILEQLGIEPPQTWDEVVAIFPALQQKNLSVGIPSVERRFGELFAPDLSGFFTQLYQVGGALYNEDGSRSLFDSEQAVTAFDTYTRFFTHYKAPLHYNFVNRFRSGEMPIGFADYNMFNQLAVFAPEIRGLWRFDLLPGIPQEDGSINRSTSCWGNASMILSNCKDPDKAWEFMRWWVSSDTQLRFGRELESVMGTAARYPTANLVAFNQLGWNARDNSVLNRQWEWVVGTPEVPGGYYVQRHIINAVRRVINDSVDMRETLLDYTRSINNELEKKRKEFGLS